MTKKYLYAVKDKKANIFDGYMILDNDAQAVRGFAQACESNEIFKKWPEDFEFYKLAEIHTEMGAILKEEEPFFLASALSFVEKPTKETKKNTK